MTISDKALKRQLKIKKIGEMIAKYKKMKVEFPDAEDREVIRHRMNWLEIEKLDVETEDLHDEYGNWCQKKEVKEKSFEPEIKEVTTRPEVVRADEVPAE